MKTLTPSSQTSAALREAIVDEFGDRIGSIIPPTENPPERAKNWHPIQASPDQDGIDVSFTWDRFRGNALTLSFNPWRFRENFAAGPGRAHRQGSVPVGLRDTSFAPDSHSRERLSG